MIVPAPYSELASLLATGRPVDWEDLDRRAGSLAVQHRLRRLRLLSEERGAHAALDALLAAEPSLRGALGDGTLAPRPAAADQAPSAWKGEADATLVATAASGAAAPRTWRHLKLLERVGGGAFGEVHRAWDQQLHRQVALKLLRPLGEDREAARARVLREGRMLARVEHPHVVRIYGVDEEGGRLGIWMEFVAGRDLQTLVAQQGPLGAREAALIGIDLCSALAAVHAADVVHRDVKAQNVIREASGRIVLMDFGAGAAGAGTGGERLAGTPLFMAPELLRGGEATPGSDLYSLGVLLFHLVTGRYPVAGADLSQIAAAHRQGPRLLLRDARPDLPAAFVQAVERALAPDPSGRYRSAGEMEAALAGALGIASVPGGQEALAAGEAVGARRRRIRNLAVAAMAVVLAGAALALQFGPWRASGPLAAGAEFRAVRGGVARDLSAGDLIAAADRLVIDLELSRDGYVYILNRDDTGALTVMYPLAGNAAGARLAGGRRHRLPGRSSDAALGWTFTAQRGIEQFLLVASTRRLEEFERELERFPAVDAGGGLTVKPVAGAAVGALTRGVAGLARLEAPGAAQAVSADYLFGLPRRLAAGEGGAADIWMHEMRLVNAGP